MGFINLAEKTISAKLVYYGCGMGGKTTSLQVVHEIMCPKNEVQLVSIKTEEDATLLFDFLPIDLGQVGGFKIRIQGFTVPGQPKYRRMRKYVLSGADAVVFVVDSETSRLEENVLSWEGLKDNLRLNGLQFGEMPLVLQYNKRDLEDILGEEELDRHFKNDPDRNSELMSFPSVATDRAGVYEAFVQAAGDLVEAKVRHYGLDKGSVDAAEVANDVRQRLWDICNDARGGEPLPQVEQRIELTFDEDGRPQDDEAKQERSAELEEAAQQEGQIDIDLDIDLDEAMDAGAGQPELTGDLRDRDEEPEQALLDAALVSNVELAKRYGELDRYKTLLQRKNRELVEITQNVVHDLRRPLSAVRLMLSSMRKGILGPEQTETAIDTGLGAIRLMERLIEDLIDSSRLDFDGVQMKFDEVDMSALVAEVVHNLRSEIEERDVGIRVEPLPTIVGDEWALTKVFMNLIGNAIQYANPDQPPRIWVSHEEKDGRHLFAIRDNGIGIRDEDKPRLFQRFERGGNTNGISGSGLGLHIIREIALGHGGNVWVDSEVGEGSTFFLAIPVEPEQPPHSEVSAVEAIEV